MGKILVTGCNGFVGQHLIKELADAGQTVIGLGGQHGSNKPQGLAEYFVIDLMDAKAVNALDLSGVDGVIHLAGLAAVGPSFDDPLNYITVNAGLEINLFEAALAKNVRPRFLIISSGALYDPTADLPLTETSQVLPSSPYAVSKLTQEQAGGYYQGRGFEVVIARPFNHIGPGQNPGFIVPDLAKQIVDVEKGAAQKILVGNLDAQRDYTDVRDIVRAYRLLLEKGQSGQIYNICSGQARSGHEILEALLKASGREVPVEQDPTKTRPSDNPLIYGSHQKLTDHTGWQPEIAFDTTIQDVIADWRSRS